MGDKWQHDMYENGSGGVTPTTPTRNTAGTGKLHISNLDYGVSDDDIRVSSFNASCFFVHELTALPSLNCRTYSRSLEGSVKLKCIMIGAGARWALLKFFLREE